jgi:hypothetical protein
MHIEISSFYQGYEEMMQEDLSRHDVERFQFESCIEARVRFQLENTNKLSSYVCSRKSYTMKLMQNKDLYIIGL